MKNATQSIKTFCSCTFIFFFFSNLWAQSKVWTGQAADGKWETATNWNGNTVPTETDEVVLDNSQLSGNYMVSLPNTLVTVKTIRISPSRGNQIELVLPTTNDLVPGLVATGSDYGLIIDAGGIFRNSSGATSGTTVDISDSVRINNEGKFIQNTQRPHASNVEVLSRMPGTEMGIFEFDVPGTKGYTLSISNRYFGTLIFKGEASTANVKTYTGTGKGTLVVRGDLRIGAGVAVNIKLTTENGNIFVYGDFIQEGGVLNLANGQVNSVFSIKGNMIQLPESLITRSIHGYPSIELNGLAQQTVKMEGTIADSIVFRINNPNGAALQAPLSIPYRLELVKGNLITTKENLLSLGSGCSLSADSSSSNQSFIDGPLRKELSKETDYFLFPVGKAGQLHWLELKNAIGNFTAEYIDQDARGISTNYGTGIHHISPKGYWEIEANPNPSALAQVELSFPFVSGTGVTDMASLRASQLFSNIWIDRKNMASTGSAGAAGSVISEMISDFHPGINHFVLASSVSDQNPLPILLLGFTANRMDEATTLNWEISEAIDLDGFEILAGTEANQLKRMAWVGGTTNKTQYEFVDTNPLQSIRYYQLRLAEKSGHSILSKIVSVRNFNGNRPWIFVQPNLVEQSAELVIDSKEDQSFQLNIISMDGRIVRKTNLKVVKGRNTLTIDLERLSSGMYLISAIDSRGEKVVVRFMKK
ncbi:MAG: T9SS type A sorting domain-containing protein [Bacteroidetes bacterium]|nr:T9SS type A sorting domain-containing protein [Bacteroidota bacterium]